MQILLIQLFLLAATSTDGFEILGFCGPNGMRIEPTNSNSMITCNQACLQVGNSAVTCRAAWRDDDIDCSSSSMQPTVGSPISCNTPAHFGNPSNILKCFCGLKGEVAELGHGFCYREPSDYSDDPWPMPNIPGGHYDLGQDSCEAKCLGTPNCVAFAYAFSSNDPQGCDLYGNSVTGGATTTGGSYNTWQGFTKCYSIGQHYEILTQGYCNDFGRIFTRKECIKAASDVGFEYAGIYDSLDLPFGCLRHEGRAIFNPRYASDDGSNDVSATASWSLICRVVADAEWTTVADGKQFRVVHTGSYLFHQVLFPRCLASTQDAIAYDLAELVPTGEEAKLSNGKVTSSGEVSSFSGIDYEYFMVENCNAIGSTPEFESQPPEGCVCQAMVRNDGNEMPDHCAPSPSSGSMICYVLEGSCNEASSSSQSDDYDYVSCSLQAHFPDAATSVPVSMISVETCADDEHLVHFLVGSESCDDWCVSLPDPLECVGAWKAVDEDSCESAAADPVVTCNTRAQNIDATHMICQCQQPSVTEFSGYCKRPFAGGLSSMPNVPSGNHIAVDKYTCKRKCMITEACVAFSYGLGLLDDQPCDLYMASPTSGEATAGSSEYPWGPPSENTCYSTDLEYEMHTFATCPDQTAIVTKDHCEIARSTLGLLWGGEVSDASVPWGCFKDQDGKAYFNEIGMLNPNGPVSLIAATEEVPVICMKLHDPRWSVMSDHSEFRASHREAWSDLPLSSGGQKPECLASAAQAQLHDLGSLLPNGAAAILDDGYLTSDGSVGSSLSQLGLGANDVEWYMVENCRSFLSTTTMPPTTTTITETTTSATTTTTTTGATTSSTTTTGATTSSTTTTGASTSSTVNSMTYNPALYYEVAAGASYGSSSLYGLGVQPSVDACFQASNLSCNDNHFRVYRTNGICFCRLAGNPSVVQLQDSVIFGKIPDHDPTLYFVVATASTFDQTSGVGIHETVEACMESSSSSCADNERRVYWVGVGMCQCANSVSPAIAYQANAIIFGKIMDSPTNTPTFEPTDSPTSNPSRIPTSIPTASPSIVPTIDPSDAPSTSPTNEPTVEPSVAPSTHPTKEPTMTPTVEPSVAPSTHPTNEPTMSPTGEPSVAPSIHPTSEPTMSPTGVPSNPPTNSPTVSPTNAQSTTAAASNSPTNEPTMSPTFEPSIAPSTHPTNEPSISPTTEPTATPTHAPTAIPTNEPTAIPTHVPTFSPTKDPTLSPSFDPTTSPSNQPTAEPSAAPTVEPSNSPSAPPSASPVSNPSLHPTVNPTAHPSAHPTPAPTESPITNSDTLPTSSPSILTSLSAAEGSVSESGEVPLEAAIIAALGAVFVVIVVGGLYYKKQWSTSGEAKQEFSENQTGGMISINIGGTITPIENELETSWEK